MKLRILGKQERNVSQTPDAASTSNGPNRALSPPTSEITPLVIAEHENTNHATVALVSSSTDGRVLNHVSQIPVSTVTTTVPTLSQFTSQGITTGSNQERFVGSFHAVERRHVPQRPLRPPPALLPISNFSDCYPVRDCDRRFPPDEALDLSLRSRRPAPGVAGVVRPPSFTIQPSDAPVARPSNRRFRFAVRLPPQTEVHSTGSTGAVPSRRALVSSPYAHPRNLFSTLISNESASYNSISVHRPVRVFTGRSLATSRDRDTFLHQRHMSDPGVYVTSTSTTTFPRNMLVPCTPSHLRSPQHVSRDVVFREVVPVRPPRLPLQPRSPLHIEGTFNVSPTSTNPVFYGQCFG